jgi:hypothetical protein
MTEFLEILTSFPTALYTVLLGVVLVYWVMVVVGVVDLDSVDLGGGLDGAAEGAMEGVAEGTMEGVAEGAMEGVAEGAMEGVAEGAAEGVAEGVAEGAAEGAADGATEAVDGAGGGLAGLLSSLGLRRAPLTVVSSLIIIYGWVLSYVLSALLLPLLSSVIPTILIGLLVLAVAFFAAIPMASITSRPLGRFFVVHKAPKKSSLVGSVCKITTGMVDDGFGQAVFDESGAGMIFQVRCDLEGGLARGDRALIVSYDDKREAYLVEPYEKMLRDRGA